MRSIIMIGSLLTLAACAGKDVEGSCVLEPKNNRKFACWSGDSVTIMPGYDAVRIFKLMKAREDNAYSQLKDVIDSGDAYVLAKERAKQTREEYGKSPRVHDIAFASVAKTVDSDATVISLTAVNGTRVSLWLYPGEQRVRTITPY